MGLEDVQRPIILDVSKDRYVVVPVKQYDIDVREIIVTVTDNGKPYVIDNSIIPRIKGKKTDNTHIYNDCTLLDSGEIKIDITDQMTSSAGMCKYELGLYDIETNKVLHPMNFIINVKESVFSQDEITSTNEFKSFENAIMKVDRIKRITESEIDELFS